MPTKSSLSAEIPTIDLPSLLLDGIPDQVEAHTDLVFTQPYLVSAEDPLFSLSLVQLKRYALQFAAGLQKAHFGRGDHLMVVAPNYINTIIIALACITAGGVFCAAQPDLKRRDYVDQMHRDEPSFLIVADEQPQCEVVLDAWQSSGRGVKGHVWLLDQVLEGHTSKQITVEHTGDSHQIPRWTELLAMNTHESFAWERFTSPKQMDQACLLFTTSGTSGLRKAAVYTHRNVVASFTGIANRSRQDAEKAATLGRSLVRGPDLRVLHTISISRAMGTTLPLSMILAAKRRPVQIFFMSKTYIDMAPYLERIQTFKINELAVAPFTLVRLFKNVDRVDHTESDFSSLARVNVVGAPSSQSNLDRVREFLASHGAPASLRVERSYGITEAAALVATPHMADEPVVRQGYQGRLEPNIEAKVIRFEEDEYLDEAPVGVTGELWLKGPSFINSYYKNASATQEAFSSDGWFKTGDIGFLEKDHVFLVDRKKDILKTPDNTPPAYIEGILEEHTDVLEAGVIGIYQPSEELQLVRAYVVRRPDSDVTGRDLETWLERQSANTCYLTGGVEFIDQLPRNEAGKLLRRVLRDHAAKHVGRLDAQSLTMSAQ
ncbi:acetyl-CoA synthetase-like protein [Viridothelium virens]|uniref:Acetyl-CoA synthetase-like protein n=1 Tax=Viridothelium virens TaxID=1048519 RepID=A0A6A6HPG1_VIRVR|nr:acetyl-CoA synthetase-like protein [Viridothelium virens]